MKAAPDKIGDDLARECERRVSQIIGDFEGLSGGVQQAFKIRLFVASAVYAGLCGMAVARAGERLTSENIEASARHILDGMMPILRRAGR